jgi:hypothetical protein
MLPLGFGVLVAFILIKILVLPVLRGVHDQCSSELKDFPEDYRDQRTRGINAMQDFGLDVGKAINRTPPTMITALWIAVCIFLILVPPIGLILIGLMIYMWFNKCGVYQKVTHRDL